MRHVVVTSSLAPATFINEEGVSLSIAAVNSAHGKRTKEISYHTTKAVELRAAIGRRNVASSKEALDAQRATTKGKSCDSNKGEVVGIHPPEYDKKQTIHNKRLLEALKYSKDYEQTKSLVCLIRYFAPEDERSIDQLCNSYCSYLKEEKKRIDLASREANKIVIPINEGRKVATKDAYSNGMPRVKHISYRADRDFYTVQMITSKGKLVKTSKDYNKALEILDELTEIKEGYLNAL